MRHFLGGIFIFALWAGASEEPVALRIEPFTVPPSTGPVIHVHVRNVLDTAFRGAISLEVPGSWRATPPSREVTLKAGETAKVPFTVEQATDSDANTYRIRVRARGAGREVVRDQIVVCASAPYFKPTIDGRSDEWGDAIPIRFMTKGKATTVSTYWNKRYFYVLVEVEEDQLCGSDRDTVDALQFALAPRTATTPQEATAQATRYEFLVTDAGAADRCVQLIAPGVELISAGRLRDPTALSTVAKAHAVVAREGRVTRYECAVPFSAMRTIKPTVGREFRFSLLVHDPDGTGLRDLGQALGLWPSSRSSLAWCRWKGGVWGETAPFDSKIEWGLCSSKH